MEPEDTPETLQRRIQEAEWQLYPKVIAALAQNRVSIQVQGD